MTDSATIAHIRYLIDTYGPDAVEEAKNQAVEISHDTTSHPFQ